MILVDAHVHIYDCFDLEIFFDSAYSNFKSAAERLGYGNEFSGILLLAETSNDNWFKHLYEYADGKNLPDGKTAGEWKFYHTDEICSLSARSENSQNLFIIAGRQIETSEGLEVLSIVSSDVYEDGISIRKTVKEVFENGGVPVLPWGVGKWFGNRGKIISNLILSENSHPVNLGDNSGRPVFWKRPQQFNIAEKNAISILPGSDSLPFVSDQTKAGSYGFWVKRVIDRQMPAHTMKLIFNDEKSTILPYGHSESIIRFFRNQIRMQLKKKVS
ncbi:MAG: hypothetical protein ACQ9MH_17000 [Nitrospinales bacterium]